MFEIKTVELQRSIGLNNTKANLFLFSFINKLISEFELACNQSLNSKSKFYHIIQRILRSNHSVLKLFIPFIRVVEAVKKNRSTYFVSAANRMYSLEFLRSAISDPTIFQKSEIFYTDVESLGTLQKFFRNKLFCAFYTTIPKNTIFTKECRYNIEACNKFQIKNVREYSKYYKVSGYYFAKPFSYESSVFYEKCGIHYLSEKSLAQLNKEQNKVILDCGAYTGDSAIVLTEAFKHLKTWAIEFSKPNFELLCTNIKKNSLSEKIVPFNLAVGNSNKTIEINHCAGLNIRQGSLGKTYDKIQMTTIDDLCKNQKTAIIKMDIEGSEMEALEGAIQTIKRDKPILLL